MHDLTQIIPSEFKGPAFKRGQTITPGDVCRLQQMGRNHLYVETASGNMSDMIHEDQAAEAFSRAMAGDGTHAENKSHEGKVNILADMDGMLVVEKERLERFNLFPDIMAASRKSYSLVKKNSIIAGTRAIPLFISADSFQSALAFLKESPLFQVKPINPSKVGILITGTEVFKGLIQDRFEDIIGDKVRRYGCEVVKDKIVADDRFAIADAIKELCDLGSKLIVTTAGLSVDPDDVTLKGLQDAGVVDMLYGTPILPGSMTLIARIGDIRIIGVPACALYFKTTSFDLLLPRILAGVRITRADLAQMAHGGLCLNCCECSFPKCPFGK
jgi:formylmethanofuran dehydrogenase subunit E